MSGPVQRRDTADVTDGVKRLVRAIGRRVAAEDVEQLEHLAELDAALTAAWDDAIRGLRANYSDMSIAAQLGVTRQAVSQRWPRT